MADQLATPTQLAAYLQQDLDAATADVVLNAATAVVQEAAGGQRILQVTDTYQLIGTTESWLWLPQRPVTAVASVELDGDELTEGTASGTYRRRGSRLWRDLGWASCAHEPSLVTVECTTGYAAGHQGIELARSAVLSLAAVPYTNPSGATSVKIDDYAEVYSALAARMEAARGVKGALRRKYGRRSGLVKVGG